MPAAGSRTGVQNRAGRVNRATSKCPAVNNLAHGFLPMHAPGRLRTAKGQSQGVAESASVYLTRMAGFPIRWC